MRVLRAPEGRVELRPARGRHLVALRPHRPDHYLPVAECETTLPPSIVEAFLALSFTDLCDVLSRHEADDVVAAMVAGQLLAYRPSQAVWGARILDFGCGTGASTVHLARLFPNTEIVGVELSAPHVAIATDVLKVRGASNARVLQSPDPTSLPHGIGTFDIVVLSAVYEHLLPAERRALMPLLWSVLKPGGILCISQTPHRWFPYEHHSTGLWGINYLPDRLAYWVATHFARMYPEANRRRTWAEHLRAGLRGGTERAILRDIRGDIRGDFGSDARILQPLAGSRARYWLAQTGPRYRTMKRLMAAIFAVTDRLFGTVPSINIDVVIEKAR